MRITSFFLALTILFAPGCKKSTVSNPDENRPPQTTEPAVTEIGTPDGLGSVTAQIGAGGGNLQSGDQRVSVIIPPGALTTTQTISITRISNHAPGGANMAYRLEPEGIRFAKPVSISFIYPTTSLGWESDPAFLGIAYQDEKRQWVGMPVKLTLATKTVTVETTHFSDWSDTWNFKLEAGSTALYPGSATEVTVMGQDDLLAPLTRGNSQEYRMPIMTKVPDQIVHSWKLEGGGKIEGTGARIRYIAPTEVPGASQNPATITATLKDKTNSYSVSIKIRTALGIIEAKLNGGKKQLLTANPIHIGPVNMLVSGTGTSPFTNIGLIIPNGVGTYPWKIGVGTPGDRPFADITLYNSNPPVYNYIYYVSDGANYIIPHASPGNVTVTSMGIIDGFVTGTFILEKSGAAGTYERTMKMIRVEGSFKLPRID